MARRSSAFDDDLAGLDELARLPVPSASQPPSSGASSVGEGPDGPVSRDGAARDPAEIDRGEARGSRPASADQPLGPTRDAVHADANAQDVAGGEVPPSRRSVEFDDEGRTETGSAEPTPSSRTAGASSTTQTAVRLPLPVTKWLSEQAARQQLTFSSVIAQAVIAHRAELVAELQAGDGLMVKRRPRTHSAPVTLRFTPAQRDLVDGLAHTLGCTRSALVLAALQAAMAIGSARP